MLQGQLTTFKQLLSLLLNLNYVIQNQPHVFVYSKLKYQISKWVQDGTNRQLFSDFSTFSVELRQKKQIYLKVVVQDCKVMETNMV